MKSLRDIYGDDVCDAVLGMPIKEVDELLGLIPPKEYQEDIDRYGTKAKNCCIVGALNLAALKQRHKLMDVVFLQWPSQSSAGEQAAASMGRGLITDEENTVIEQAIIAWDGVPSFSDRAKLRRDLVNRLLAKES